MNYYTNTSNGQREWAPCVRQERANAVEYLAGSRTRSHTANAIFGFCRSTVGQSKQNAKFALDNRRWQQSVQSSSGDACIWLEMPKVSISCTSERNWFTKNILFFFVWLLHAACGLPCQKWTKCEFRIHSMVLSIQHRTENNWILHGMVQTIWQRVVIRSRAQQRVNRATTQIWKTMRRRRD